MVKKRREFMTCFKILFAFSISISIIACGDNSSNSSSTDSCSYDAISNTYFCKDENGDYAYAILPDGTKQEITTLPDSQPDSLNDSTAQLTCTDLLPSFILNDIHYYVENEKTFYFDESCNQIFLTGTEVPSSADNAYSSQETISSSSQTVAISSSSVAISYNPNGTEKQIIFSNAGIEITNDSCLEITNTTVKITCAGQYYLSGNSDNFQIMVSANDSDKVYLYLNNLTLSSTDAPIYVQNADKTFLMLIDGTTNTLADASSRTTTYTKTDGTPDTTNACIYSKDDLTFKGNGSLIIYGNYKNGIQSSNDIKIKDFPQVTITATNHGIKGKGSVEIEGGNFTINTTNGDAIKSDEGEDEGYIADKGYVQITGGNFNITAGDDGIQAYNYVFIADSNAVPSFEIKTGTGASAQTNSGSMGGLWGETSATTTDSTSLKAIKADSLVLINAGIFTINSADDAIHSNGTVRINGGDITIAATDDAIHGDVLFQLNGGKISVSQCYEGFEAYELEINGGETSVSASDDAWNAAGGTDNTSSGDSFRPGQSNSTSSGVIHIKGGYHYVKTGSGDTDGIDSNGDINITGGVLVIEAGGNIIDNNGSVNYTAGILLGMGKQIEGIPSSGNPKCFSSLSANTRFSVMSNGTVLSTFTATQSASTGIYVNSTTGDFYTGGTYSNPTIETFFGYGEGGSLSGQNQLSANTCSSSGMGGW